MDPFHMTTADKAMLERMQTVQEIASRFWIKAAIKFWSEALFDPFGLNHLSKKAEAEKKRRGGDE